MVCDIGPFHISHHPSALFLSSLHSRPLPSRSHESHKNLEFQLCAMAEALLVSLPKVGRGILAKEDQRCPISIEEYGTVPSPSGTIECAVRLSCNHVVESECISIWLTASRGEHSSNTCPVCRYVLFEVEQPEMEASQEVIEHTQIYFDLDRYIYVLALHLDLGYDAAQMAGFIAKNVHERGPMGDHSVVSVAAASLYMASHATGDPRSRHAFSRMNSIAGLGDVGIEDLSRTYDWLYRDRRVLLHEPQLRRVTPWTLESVDAVLPLPQT